MTPSSGPLPAGPTTAELSEALGGSIATSTAVTEVTRRLLDYFTSGSVELGARLPPERQLAASMGVGRSAVREALAALEVLGVVQVRPGSGTYLHGSVSELLPQTLSWGMLIGTPKTLELLDIRSGLEVQAARGAARHITAEGLATLEGHLATMQASTADFDAFVTADLRFHQALADAAENSLLADMLSSVRSLLRVWVERALNDSDHARTTCREHQAILDALIAHDPDRTALAMSRHMDSAAARLTTAF